MGQIQTAEKNFHIIAKPSGPLCNLDCHYCFYTEKEALFSGRPSYQMSDEVLENFIENYIKGNKRQKCRLSGKAVSQLLWG